MSTIKTHYFSTSLTLLAAFLPVACADTPTQPELATPASATIVEASVDLGPCDSLAVPTGHLLAARTYAQGVQIYRWNGSGWVFDAPEAQLTADAAGGGVVPSPLRVAPTRGQCGGAGA